MFVLDLSQKSKKKLRTSTVDSEDELATKARVAEPVGQVVKGGSVSTGSKEHGGHKLRNHVPLLKQKHKVREGAVGDQDELVSVHQIVDKCSVDLLCAL